MRKRSALQDELQQRRPFRSPQEEAALGIRRSADVLRHPMKPFFEANGLTAQQYNVLRILRGALPEPLSTMKIADRMLEKTPERSGSRPVLLGIPGSLRRDSFKRRLLRAAEQLAADDLDQRLAVSELHRRFDETGRLIDEDVRTALGHIVARIASAAAR